MAKWIEFVEVFTINLRKTKIYSVRNKESQAEIGLIKWYGAWRQYAFFPAPQCVFERQCLTDITRFIDDLMTARKTNK